MRCFWLPIRLLSNFNGISIILVEILEVSLRKRRVAVEVIKRGQIRAAIAHVATLILGDPTYWRPASSIDFKKNRISSFQSLTEMLQRLLPNLTNSEIEKVLKHVGESLEKDLIQNQKVPNFPAVWNAGRNLQFLLASLVILTQPKFVVETGTANGASAAAIAWALRENSTGHLWSFDIVDANPTLVPVSLLEYITFEKVSGDAIDLKRRIGRFKENNGVSIFLHDSDHSYLGQESDYDIASSLEFDFIVSDDVDTSLAFTEFARDRGLVIFDAPKFIGITRGE